RWQRRRIRRIHHPRLLLPRRAEFRRHHRPGPPPRRPTSPRPPLPHRRCSPLWHGNPHGESWDVCHLATRARIVTDTRQPITPATAAEWRRRREASGDLPSAPDERPRNGFDGQSGNGFRVPTYAPVVQSQDASTRFAESQQAGLAAIAGLAAPAAPPRPRASPESAVSPAQAPKALPAPATRGQAAASPVSAVIERPLASLSPPANPPGRETTRGSLREPTAAQASSNFAQLHAMPLIVVLTLEVFLSLRLVTSNTAFTDEAMYLWAGRLEWSHWLH